MNGIPRIKEVKPLDNMFLNVIFQNGISKKYDVKPLIKKYAVFSQLQNRAIFNLVRVDCGGFGIVWTDEIDLSEYEIWENGINNSTEMALMEAQEAFKGEAERLGLNSEKDIVDMVKQVRKALVNELDLK